QTDFSTFLHGSKCGAQFSGNVHAPTTRIFKSQVAEDSNIAWEPEEETRNPYQVEWDELLTAIREDKPYNEVQRSGYTNMTALMGRAAVHTGQIVTWDQMMDSNFQFASSVDFTMESPSPVPANADGHYPIPVPGEWKEV
ncbi:MAG: gfo/Idh/MocA family oxidoreductase, partial [Candidatus Omnitrophica bacterium]|nr:gfo/Idh/MocA family oxidoreductase [Candidatus Omnitrophota bacterium]